MKGCICHFHIQGDDILCESCGDWRSLQTMIFSFLSRSRLVAVTVAVLETAVAYAERMAAAAVAPAEALFCSPPPAAVMPAHGCKTNDKALI